MEDSRLLKSIRLKNFLSYGSNGQTVELEPLNVLIGSNASGKSNLLEALQLLNATPTDLAMLVRGAGGISDLLWKGAKQPPIAEIETYLNNPKGFNTASKSLRYQISFTVDASKRLEIVDELLENEDKAFPEAPDVLFYYRFQNGYPVLNVKESVQQQGDTRVQRRLRREDIKPDQSVLSQRKDPDYYPELTYVSNQFTSIKLYRDWTLGQFSLPRTPQKLGMTGDFLLPDASNLGLVLNKLQATPEGDYIIEKFRDLSPSARAINTVFDGDYVHTLIREENLYQPIPATRLSDGTLRFLFLLTLLGHPTPPPLICIEEPELGLHPDMIHIIADMLVEASQRTQLVVTTHSTHLVSALTNIPEAVVVCERDQEGTQLRRLEAEPLKEWLDMYSLGELWMKGNLGGTRW